VLLLSLWFLRSFPRCDSVAAPPLVLYPPGFSAATRPPYCAVVGSAEEPPFPHAVLVLPTQQLSDDGCTICNFNIAFSKPDAGDGVWGSQTPGASAASIVEHWEAVRRSNEADDYKGRRGSEWNDPMKVPTLVGDQITFRPKDVGCKATKHKTCKGDSVAVPELLLRSPLRPNVHGTCWTVYVFSNYDRQSLALLGDPPDWLKIQVSSAIPWYSKPQRRSTNT
jgi:hypothetical protein